MSKKRPSSVLFDDDLVKEEMDEEEEVIPQEAEGFEEYDEQDMLYNTIPTTPERDTKRARLNPELLPVKKDEDEEARKRDKLIRLVYELLIGEQWASFLLLDSPHLRLLPHFAEYLKRQTDRLSMEGLWAIVINIERINADYRREVRDRQRKLGLVRPVDIQVSVDDEHGVLLHRELAPGGQGPTIRVVTPSSDHVYFVQHIDDADRDKLRTAICRYILGINNVDQAASVYLLGDLVQYATDVELLNMVQDAFVFYLDRASLELYDAPPGVLPNYVRYVYDMLMNGQLPVLFAKILLYAHHPKIMKLTAQLATNNAFIDITNAIRDFMQLNQPSQSIDAIRQGLFDAGYALQAVNEAMTRSFGNTIWNDVMYRHEEHILQWMLQQEQVKMNGTNSGILQMSPGLGATTVATTLVASDFLSQVKDLVKNFMPYQPDISSQIEHIKPIHTEFRQTRGVTLVITERGSVFWWKKLLTNTSLLFDVRYGFDALLYIDSNAKVRSSQQERMANPDFDMIITTREIFDADVDMLFPVVASDDVTAGVHLNSAFKLNRVIVDHAERNYSFRTLQSYKNLKRVLDDNPNAPCWLLVHDINYASEAGALALFDLVRCDDTWLNNQTDQGPNETALAYKKRMASWDQFYSTTTIVKTHVNKKAFFTVAGPEEKAVLKALWHQAFTLYGFAEANDRSLDKDALWKSAITAYDRLRLAELCYLDLPDDTKQQMERERRLLSEYSEAAGWITIPDIPRYRPSFWSTIVGWKTDPKVQEEARQQFEEAYMDRCGRFKQGYTDVLDAMQKDRKLVKANPSIHGFYVLVLCDNETVAARFAWYCNRKLANVVEFADSPRYIEYFPSYTINADENEINEVRETLMQNMVDFTSPLKGLVATFESVSSDVEFQHVRRVIMLNRPMNTYWETFALSRLSSYKRPVEHGNVEVYSYDTNTSNDTRTTSSRYARFTRAQESYRKGIYTEAAKGDDDSPFDKQGPLKESIKTLFVDDSVSY